MTQDKLQQKRNIYQMKAQKIMYNISEIEKNLLSGTPLKIQNGGLKTGYFYFLIFTRKILILAHINELKLNIKSYIAVNLVVTVCLYLFSVLEIQHIRSFTCKLK